MCLLSVNDLEAGLIAFFIVLIYFIFLYKMGFLK